MVWNAMCLERAAGGAGTTRTDSSGRGEPAARKATSLVKVHSRFTWAAGSGLRGVHSPARGVLGWVRSTPALAGARPVTGEAIGASPPSSMLSHGLRARPVHEGGAAGRTGRARRRLSPPQRVQAEDARHAPCR